MIINQMIYACLLRKIVMLSFSYHINSSWDEHYNVNVTLTNITDEKIDDWEIKLPANFL